MIIDLKLSFRDKLEYACKKATSVTATFARMLLNISGPKYCRRPLLAEVVRFILAYASSVWPEVLANSHRKKQVNSVYRLMTLTVSSAFRTTSDEVKLGEGREPRENSWEDVAADRELAYAILRNCKNMERAGERSKEEKYILSSLTSRR